MQTREWARSLRFAAYLLQKRNVIRDCRIRMHIKKECFLAESIYLQKSADMHDFEPQKKLLDTPRPYMNKLKTFPATQMSFSHTPLLHCEQTYKIIHSSFVYKLKRYMQSKTRSQASKSCSSFEEFSIFLTWKTLVSCSFT